MSNKDNGSLRIGLALGSGSSRGWAHIGIIKALAELGVRPDIICGCSIGSIVGAAHAAGNLDRLEGWVRSLNKRDVAGFFELSLTLNGFVDAERLSSFLARHVCAEERVIEDLGISFASVSTDLASGREVWFTEGSVLNAIVASIALPGLFAPVRSQGRWLVDGGLVNPVPVSICHALGADIVIGVNLNGDIVGRHHVPKVKPPARSGALETLVDTLKTYSSTLFSSEKREEEPPSLFESIAGSINIVQDRITRSRMAGDPPDILLNPKLAHIGLLEFYRAEDAIAEGEDCVRRMLPEIKHVLGRA